MISAIIVTHNNEQTVRRCLASIRSPLVREIILVDSKSTDRTMEHVKGATAVHRLSENKGFAVAANIGARHSAAPFLLFVNPDAQLTDGALEAAIDVFRQERAVGIVGLGLYSDQGVLEQESFGPPVSLTSILVHKALRRKKQMNRVGWVSAGACIVRREVFEQLKGFDEGYFLYWEDVDFCTRARSAGWSIRFLPEARGVHSRGASMDDIAAKTRIYDESADRFFRTHYATPIWLFYRILRYIYRLLSPRVF